MVHGGVDHEARRVDDDEAVGVEDVALHRVAVDRRVAEERTVDVDGALSVDEHRPAWNIQEDVCWWTRRTTYVHM